MYDLNFLSNTSRLFMEAFTDTALSLKFVYLGKKHREGGGKGLFTQQGARGMEGRDVHSSIIPFFPLIRIWGSYVLSQQDVEVILKRLLEVSVFFVCLLYCMYVCVCVCFIYHVFMLILFPDGLISFRRGCW